MIQYRCSVHDKATGLFSRPVYVASPAQAIRSFSDEVNRKGDDNPLNRHPADYGLYQLGTFDDEAGTCHDLDRPLLLISGTHAHLE
jgi:hypothetical protein